MRKQKSVVKKSEISKEIRNRKTGFTLIELLVSIGVFSIIIGAVVGLFISGAREQRFALTTQSLLDQTSFALDFMSRALRAAQKDSQGTCLSQVNSNYELTRAGSGVKFVNSAENNDCQELFLEASQLKLFKQSSGLTLPLTSGNLEITWLKFNLIGGTQEDDLQPRLTLSFEIKGKKEATQGVRLQTTVSQRQLDVEL